MLYEVCRGIYLTLHETYERFIEKEEFEEILSCLKHTEEIFRDKRRIFLYERLKG